MTMKLHTKTRPDLDDNCNVILFGPPGIGKSTMIGALKLAGCKAIDAEDIESSRLRFQLPSVVSNTFIGAADLNPRRQYRNCLKVLLTLKDQKQYDEQRKARDRLHPGKASQRSHTLEEWANLTDYDLVFQLDRKSPSSMTSEVRRLENALTELCGPSIGRRLIN